MDFCLFLNKEFNVLKNMYSSSFSIDKFFIHVLYNINLVLFIVQEFTHLLYFKKYLSYTLHQILILKYSKCIYLK